MYAYLSSTSWLGGDDSAPILRYPIGLAASASIDLAAGVERISKSPVRSVAVAGHNYESRAPYGPEIFLLGRFRYFCALLPSADGDRDDQVCVKEAPQVRPSTRQHPQ
jgi:hypothetical protein